MENLISFLSDISIDGNIEANGFSKTLNTNIWLDTGTESEMIVSVKGKIHGLENQDIITDYDQLLGIPIKVRKRLNLGENQSLKVNINSLGVKECKRYIKSDDEITNLFEKHSIKSSQIIELLWNGAFFIVFNTLKNDFTDEEKEKLLRIEANANKYIHPLKHSADMIEGLSTVSKTGSYDDLIDKPFIPVIPDTATQSKDGLMSAEDKEKLDNIDGQIGNAVSDLDEKINIVHISLNDKISVVSQTSDNKINEVSQTISNKIDKVSLENEELLTDIKEGIDGLKNDISEITANLSEDIEMPPFGFSCEFKRSIDDTWTVLPMYPMTSSSFRYSSMASIDNDIYIVGGETKALKQLCKYNLITKTWTILAACPESAQFSSMNVFNRELYVMCPNVTPNNKLFKYTPSSNKWTALAACPNDAQNSSAVIVNGELYVVGGGSTSTKLMRKYNISKNVWTNLADCPYEARYSSVTELDGDIYLIGTNTSPYSQLLKYKPSINSWFSLAASPAHSIQAKCTAINGELYVMNGGGSPYMLLRKYSPKTNSWLAMADCPNSASNASITSVGDELYLAGTNFIKYSPFTVKFKNQIVAEVKKGQKIYYNAGTSSAYLTLNNKKVSEGKSIAESDGYLKTELTDINSNYIRGWIK